MSVRTAAQEAIRWLDRDCNDEHFLVNDGNCNSGDANTGINSIKVEPVAGVR